MYSMLNSIQSHYYLYFIETFDCGPIKFGFEYPCFIFCISSPDVGTRYLTGVFHTQNILIFNNIKKTKTHQSGLFVQTIVPRQVGTLAAE